MPNALSLNHLYVPAEDPELLRRWYAEKLGFDRRGGLLWSNGSLLVFFEGRPMIDHGYHFGFRVGSLEELGEWVGVLRSRGLDVPDVQGNENFSAVYLKDPEGNTIEIFYEPLPQARIGDEPVEAVEDVKHHRLFE